MLYTNILRDAAPKVMTPSYFHENYNKNWELWRLMKKKIN